MAQKFLDHKLAEIYAAFGDSFDDAAVVYKHEVRPHYYYLCFRIALRIIFYIGQQVLASFLYVDALMLQAIG